MLSIVNVLNKERFSPRFYVAAATDNMSLQKAQVLEQSLLHQGKGNAEAAQFMQIYRSREVGQSYITSIGTSLIAIAHAIWFILKIRPQVIICNGPGTCIPLCVAAFMFKVVGLRWSSIFYIESIARVRKLSLSGLLLYKLHLTDQFVVQWPQLQSKYPQSQYVGRIM
ncbi:Oligosaccharide biosynthesis protein Alg14-like protein [Dioscorea alata]|nr:Oligosaccharide biosynthesis protein Alg14-like protein [Dioscorea alata]